MANHSCPKKSSELPNRADTTTNPQSTSQRLENPVSSKENRSSHAQSKDLLSNSTFATGKIKGEFCRPVNYYELRKNATNFTGSVPSQSNDQNIPPESNIEHGKLILNCLLSFTCVFFVFYVAYYDLN